MPPVGASYGVLLCDAIRIKDLEITERVCVCGCVGEQCGVVWCGVGDGEGT